MPINTKPKRDLRFLCISNARFFSPNVWSHLECVMVICISGWHPWGPWQNFWFMVTGGIPCNSKMKIWKFICTKDAAGAALMSISSCEERCEHKCLTLTCSKSGKVSAVISCSRWELRTTSLSCNQSWTAISLYSHSWASTIEPAKWCQFFLGINNHIVLYFITSEKIRPAKLGAFQANNAPKVMGNYPDYS